MAFLTLQKWYCGSTKWTAVTAWAATTAYSAGQLVRQLAAPAVGSERVFCCVVAGTSGGSEPTWTITQGAKTTDNTATWIDVTGKAGVNGDLTNTSNWNIVKNTAVSLGVIIQRISGGSLQICTTAGTASNGAEPSFSNTAGVTTSDGTITWTSLGAPSNFAAYAAPMARLSLGLATGNFMAASDTLYVSNNHNETQASAITYDKGLGTASSIQNIICVNDSVAPPTALATTAKVSTTGANNLVIGNNIYVYGITFSAGDGANNVLLIFADTSSNLPAVFENCGFALGTTSTTATSINFSQTSASAGGSYIKLINPTLVLAATGQTIKCSGRIIIRNATVAATGSIPTTAFTILGAGYLLIEDTDLSQITGSLFGSVNSTSLIDIDLNNCKLASGVTIVNGGATAISGPRVRMVNCDNANTNYRYFLSRGTGNAQQETTIIRTGGATDGTTPISWNIQSTTQACYGIPFVSDEITLWNSVTGSSKTATVYLTSNTALDNSLCWLEVEYPSSSSAPLGATVNTRAALLSTPVALTTDSSTWGGSALSHLYSIAASFTPQKAGPIKARLYVADPSIQIYFDPLPVIS